MLSSYRHGSTRQRLPVSSSPTSMSPYSPGSRQSPRQPSLLPGGPSWGSQSPATAVSSASRSARRSATGAGVRKARLVSHGDGSWPAHRFAVPWTSGGGGRRRGRGGRGGEGRQMGGLHPASRRSGGGSQLASTRVGAGAAAARADVREEAREGGQRRRLRARRVATGGEQAMTAGRRASGDDGPPFDPWLMGKRRERKGNEWVPLTAGI